LVELFSDNVVVYALGIPPVIAVLMLMLKGYAKQIVSMLAGILLLGLTILSYAQVAGTSGTLGIPWGNGYLLQFAHSNLSLFFGVLLWAWTALVSVPKHKERFHWFWFWVALSGISILLLAKDGVSFFMGWEIMTWAVFLVLMHSQTVQAKNLLLYFVMGAASGFALLGSFVLLYQQACSFSLQDMGSAIQGLSLGQQMLHFVLLWGAFLIKIAAMPLHLWLEGVYVQGPHRLTVFLSAVLSKIGVYGAIVLPFAWFYPVMQHWAYFIQTPVAGNALAWLGGITSFVATFKAIQQKNAKALLAWSSVAQLGYVLTALGLHSAVGLAGALYHSLNHALISGLLFLAVAAIVQRTGTDRFTELGALISKMPFAFMAVLIGIIGLAGMPPLPGFAGKWLIYTALLQQKSIPLLLVVIASSTAAFLYCYRLIYGIFLGQPTKVKPSQVQEISWSYRIPIAILMLALMITGTLPGLIVPVINDVLAQLALPTLVHTGATVLHSGMGQIAGMQVMFTFGLAFVVILLLFSLHTVKTRHVHHLDIAYAAEVPTDTTPLHYGGGLGAELHRIPLIGWLQKRSVWPWYLWVVNHVKALGAICASFYQSGPRMAFVATVTIVVMIVVWAGGAI
jgi:formate hydrogenlyase subunit 3/multisubunit Na+/H+ antiporter MnhD subunit